MITIDGQFLKDEYDRVLLLRGVNLGGSSKIPFEPNSATHLPYTLYSNKKISFVNRPFPLKEADEHFSRLKNWGFRFIRFLVTWEAIEHQAPGVYDEAYLDYIAQLLRKAQEYDIQVLIDPHQDVWSRFSGGDGAPLWTFEKVGLNVRHFHESGVAILHQAEGDKFEEMIWATNYNKFACATMFTLFFAGKDFAPHLEIDGVNIQTYLQEHYCNAMLQLAQKLKDFDNVVGFDTMNEPSAGWIGYQDLSQNEFLLKKGATPTPFQSMLLASGISVKVENWKLGRKGLYPKGKIELNPKAIKTWLNGFKCVWKNHGVWSILTNGEYNLDKPHYFSEIAGRKVNFNQDYLLPFVRKYAQTIRTVKKDWLIFFENPVNETPPVWGVNDPLNIVYAPHWYDFLTLFTKRFRSWLSLDIDTQKIVFGRKKVQQMFVRQLAKIKKYSQDFLMNVPVLIGEMGVPMDMNRKKSFKLGKFKSQTKALNMYMKAIEENLLHLTLWNYTSDNTNEHGDQWNKEDLSIFSRDQQKDSSNLNEGGRSLEAVVRPYPIKIAGTPIRLSFDLQKKVFEFEFEHHTKVKKPTEIFVPKLQYPNGFKVTVSDGNFDIDEENQLLLYHYSIEKNRHIIRITK